MNSDAVAVIVVTYNAESDIEACLASIAATTVIVIDNASTDGTRAVLRRLESNGIITDLVLNEANVGFAKAVNIGLRRTTGDVLLLNPDAMLSPASFAALKKVAADPEIGIVTPLVSSGPTVHALAAGEQPRLWPMFTHFSGLARLFPRTHWLRGRYIYRGSMQTPLADVGWVSGGCLYLTERARAAVGELSERWFMYGEDVDLCHRVTRAGLRVVVARDIDAFHAIGSSVNTSTGPVTTMWAVNTLDYYRTTFSRGPVDIFLWRLIFSSGMLARSALIAARGILSSTGRPAALARARRFRRFGLAVWTARTAS